MKRLISSLMLVMMFLSLSLTAINALDIKKNIYAGAFDTKEYPIKDAYLRDILPYDTDGEPSDYIYDMVIYGPVVEGGVGERIDRVYMDYPSYEERLNEYYTEELEHKFVYEGEEKRIIAEGAISAHNYVRIELGSWEYFIESKLDNYQLTTLAGYPAILKETGSKTFMENPESGYNSSYSISGYVLIDDENISGCVVLEVSVSLTYKILGGGMGEGWDEQWDIYQVKEVNFWYDNLIPKFEEYLEKATDISVTIIRERLYEGEIGVGLTEEDKEKENVTGVIDTDADSHAGESAVSIPEAIVVAVLGLGAAIAGTAAGGSSGKDDDSSKKKSSYKMSLRKDFKNAVRIGAAPVTIYARIIEITETGREVDRPDLTALITITKKSYLEVDGCQLAGNYMGALIYAPDEPGKAKPEQGVVSIKFAGNEGSFTNNVSFNIIGKPFLEFKDQKNYLQMTLNMLLGDQDTYETTFVPQDFLNEPNKITLKPADDALFSAEYEKTENDQYILKIKNQTSKSDKVVLQKTSSFVKIIAENDKEQAESVVQVDIYPEGISVSNVTIKDDRLQFVAFDNEETSEYGDVKPTRFDLHLVIKKLTTNNKPQVIVVDEDQFEPKFDKLLGTDTKTNILSEKFKYEIVPVTSNIKRFDFTPLEALVEEENHPFNVLLPITSTYEDKIYDVQLPIRLMGGGPGPMEERARELAKMKRIIGRVGGIGKNVAMQLRKNGSKLSAAELRLINKQICQEAIDYYTKDAQELIATGKTLESLEYWADWIKWLGDQAFSYLMSVYTGSGEIILTPAKEMTVEFIAELIADTLDDQNPSTMDFATRLDKLNALKRIDAMIENFLMGVATGENVSIKKAGSCLAGWFVYKVAKNIQDNIEKTGNYHVFDAILMAGKDLTVEAMKKAGMKQFDKLLKNPSVRDKFEKWFGGFVSKHLKNNYELIYNELGNIEIKDLATRTGALK